MILKPLEEPVILKTEVESTNLVEELRNSAKPLNDTDESNEVYEENKTENVILSFMKNNGLEVVSFNEFDENNCLYYLVKEIARSLPACGELLHKLRIADVSPNKNFQCDISHYPENDKQHIYNLCNVLKNCGVFSEFIASGNIFKGKISCCNKVGEFISGKWLEMYCQKITNDVLKEFSEADKIPYELLANVVIKNSSGETHEIDLIFSLGKDIFATEEKSGNNFCNYERFRKIGAFLHLIPDHFVLINSTLENSNEMEIIHYFYDYYVTNTIHYSEVLTKMITKNI